MAKAKGTTLIGAVRFLRRHKEAARAGLPPEHHHYLEERVQESSWYPEPDLLALIRAMLPLVPGSRQRALAEMGALTARQHLEGVYAHLRDGARDPSAVSRRAFALWGSQHDSGRLDVERTGPHEIRMSVRDFALPSEEMCGIFGGYFAETIRMQGFAEVDVDKRECVLRGDPRCAWILHFAWESGDARD